MSRITDAGYRLPIIYAQRFNSNFRESANQPLLISGVDMEASEKGDFVVKFVNAPRMSQEASMRELLASFIAMEMNIPVVEPVIIEITAEFVDLLKGNTAWAVGSRSLGYNYGSGYIRGYSTLILSKTLTEYQIPLAQDALAFDIFIQNPDRTVEKPNLLTDGRDLVILDHELAFGFIFVPFITANIWEMREEHKDWISRHCLLPLLKGKPYDYDAFAAKFNNLNEDFWGKASQLIPKEWLTDQFDGIKNILTGIIVNREKFIAELKKIMS